MELESGQPDEIGAKQDAIARSMRCTEGILPEGKKRYRLQLKNGSEVDAREAYGQWRSLTAHQANSPDQFQALVLLAQGKPISSHFHEELRKHFAWFDRGGTLLQLVRDVLISAVRESPDGTVLVNPFQLTNDADVQRFDQLEHDYERFLARLFRGGGPGNPSR